MSESTKPWGSEDVFDWYLTDDCKVNVAVPLGEGKSLELMIALLTINESIKEKNYDLASHHVGMLAKLAIAAAMQDNKLLAELEEEVLLDNFNRNFDDYIEFLNKEEHD